MSKFQTQCQEAVEFCRQAANAQLPNIHRDETDRAERHGHDSEIGRLAASFAASAKAEMIRRDTWEG
jgi:hypothetical protein